MTPNKLALALLSTLAAVGAAQAIDVKIYGQANGSLYYIDTKAGGSSLSMQNESSRVGLTITEALNPGTSINVYLETGFNLDNGALTNNGGNNVGNTLFDRRAILSVKDVDWGEIAFGRMGTVRSSMAPYGYGLGAIDPFGTNYGPDGSISGMFGNDDRGNNTITYMTPKVAGFGAGVSYSLSTYDQEDAQSTHNNRHLSGIVNYTGERLYAVLGATYKWHGRNHSAGADRGTAYDREDSSVYTLGGWYQLTDTLRLYAAAQYHKDFRNVAAWNIDSFYGDGARRYGIDGTTALIGFTQKFGGSWRLLGDYMYFDGSHQLDNGDDLDAKRHIVNAALEYWLTKRTHAFTTVSWSKGTGALASSRIMDQTGDASRDVNRISARVGLSHYF